MDTTETNYTPPIAVVKSGHLWLAFPMAMVVGFGLFPILMAGGTDLVLNCLGLYSIYIIVENIQNVKNNLVLWNEVRKFRKELKNGTHGPSA